MEKRIAELDVMITELDYSDESKAKSILEEYEKVKTDLDAQMALWEEGTEGLLELEG